MNDKVTCPFCSEEIDLTKENWVLVDSEISGRDKQRAFCNYKCLGMWIFDVYIQGKQFEYGLEVINE